MGKRFGIAATLLLVFALCLGVVGCGGIDTSKFTGTWVLSSSSAENLNDENIELMKSLGLEVTLTLNADKKGTMNLYGQENAVTWEPKSPTEATIAMQDTGDANMRIDGDSLVMEDSSTSMTFKKKS